VTAIQCPRCGRYSPENGARCDCGYDFAASQVKESYSTDESRKPKKKKSLLYRIVAILIGLFVAVLVVFVAVLGTILVTCGGQKRA